MANSNSVRGPLMLLGILFIICLIIFWPGIVSPDAASQYAAARIGFYTDHHPPVMSFVWRYLDKVYSGSGPILLMHLSLLYAAAAVFIITFKDSKFKWWFAVLPLIPNIIAYTPLIVKDVGFTYAYLLAGALLAYLMVTKQKKYKYVLLTLALILLFYGTSVKFQARYLLIFFTLGAGYCIDYKFNRRALFSGIALCLVLLQAMFCLNNYLVPSTQESNSWQLVKLYDLSGISIRLDEPLFPEFIKQNPNFSFERVKQEFSPSEVDPLVFPADSVFRTGVDEQQRRELLSYWRVIVLENPLQYLQVRLHLWSFNLFSTPSGRSNPVDYFKNTNMADWLNQPMVLSMVDVLYKVSQVALQFIWLLLLLVLYTVLAVFKRRKSVYAVPLIMFCGASWMLLGVLFFCSMAATSRYVFFCACLVHASHAFAYRAFKE